MNNWKPSGAQWLSIVATYAIAMIFWLDDGNEYSEEFSRRATGAVVVAGAIAYWYLQGRKPKTPHMSASTENQNASSFSSAVGALLSIQLLPAYADIKSAFSVLMTNRRAAGYVFGFHDGLLQKSGLNIEARARAAPALIRESYELNFGTQAGFALYQMSIGSQGDKDFAEGRLIGGNEIADYIDAKTPPLGLGRIVLLGMKS